MEALAAVGLAGNVVQFVQFSSDLIKLAREIKRKGQPSSLHELKRLTEELVRQSNSIKTRLESSKDPLEQEEQHLLQLAHDCCMTGEHVVTYVDQLTNSLSHSNALKSSFKIKWEHGRLDQHVLSLQNLQSSLILATNLALRSRTATKDGEILEHLRRLEAEMQSAQKTDSQLLGAIETITDAIEAQSGPKLTAMHLEIENCLEGIESVRKGLEITFSREREILNWLQFRQKSWRYHEIDEAHQETFGWIFREPNGDTLWDDFSQHLITSEVTRPYFINGKAGSGKSTLMKYIRNHPETREKLEIWSAREKLLILNVFFWNLGTELQKSRNGMLRSLLHGLLAAYPELIPAAFPDLYKDRSKLEEPPEFFELKKAFDIAKAKSVPFLRLCVFVDGIDEYDGDHRDMSEFVYKMVSVNTKVIVSSRPINACMSIFKDCPTLKLQDLTAPDMNIFIRDRLASHEMMEDMRADYPKEVHEMVTTIQEKAEGVFLWVRLVVKLLLRGLEDGDEMSDLLVKLHSLPSDLRKLYSRMLRQMQPEYQVQASQIFQIFEAWRALTQEQPMEVLILAFAVRPVQLIVEQPIKPMSSEEKRRLVDRTDARVRSRCCGLLEVRTLRSELASQPPKHIMTYLHRSVSEFLSVESAWPGIRSLTKGTHFDPSLSTAFGLLCNLKVSEWVNHPDLHGCFRRLSDPIEHNLELMMAFCRAVGDAKQSHIRCFMEELDNTMSALCLEICDHARWKVNGEKKSNTMEYLLEHKTTRRNLEVALLVRYLQTNMEWHWSACIEPQLIQMATIQNPSHLRVLYEMASRDTYAAYAGFYRHVRDRYESDNDNDPPLPAHFMFIFALQSWKTSAIPLLGTVPISARWATLQYLLGRMSMMGDAAQVKVFDSTIWDHLIVMAYQLKTELKSNKSDARQLLHLAVTATKDPSSLFEKKTRCNPSLSAATLGYGSYHDFKSTMNSTAQDEERLSAETDISTLQDQFSAEHILPTRLSSHPLNHYYSMNEDETLDETTFLPIVRRVI